MPAPTGPIKTPAPNGGYYGEWSLITRWDDNLIAACAKRGVPIERARGHQVTESQGNPAAYQRNPTNGDSFGLFQVVPRYWKSTIESISGKRYATEAEAGAAMVNDPALACQAGCAVLWSYYDKHGDWDKASSAFFVGNPNWQGGDYVNGTTATAYRDTLNGLIAEQQKQGVTTVAMKEWAVAGSSKKLLLPDDIDFIIALIPPTQTNQRPGFKLVATSYTQHETGNPNPGADAAMHSNYMDIGAPDRYGRKQQLGYHFTVSKAPGKRAQVFQKIPLNEGTWHAGDGGNGPGNTTSVSCELCINADRDKDGSEAAAAALAAGVMDVQGIPDNKLVTHWSWVAGTDGAHYCPETILTEGRWPQFQQRVASARGGKAPAPAPSYVAPIPLDKEWTGDDYTRTDGTVFYALRRRWVAGKAGAHARQWADKTAMETRAPLAAGETFMGDWVVAIASEWWIVTASSSRILLSECESALELEAA